MKDTAVTADDLPGLNCGTCGFRTCEALSKQLETEPELLKRCIHYSTDKSASDETILWQDSLGRDFDFYLDHFPSEPGPREIIIPHNPILTRELDVQVGDMLVGRPLGMSCGCPVTHCGVVMQVDQRTGVIVWCVTGPLRSRQEGFKDLGYYIAEGYEGLVHKKRCDLKIGMRYFFQPSMCMLQWRHSGLINYLNRTPDALQVRIEGLWIG
ncbi:MAG: (Fe-S)-binding protein [Alphaproteobacteria bacterium]|nr:(Fe-S)-binding protein [Alphaproteobacteria bacterium]